MQWEELPDDVQEMIRVVLGYLNFSSGAADARFLGDLNRLFGWLAEGIPPVGDPDVPVWRRLGQVLQKGLAHLRQTSEPFRKAEQAQAVIQLVFDRALPGYREYHRDLLFHQTEESLFQPFFIGRVCEAVLAEGGPWGDADRIVSGAIRRLNDYVGHRPVAVLRTRQKLQPYEHEWVRPVPLFIQGAGVAVGPYHDVIEAALKILAETSDRLLAQAWFDLDLLSELAVDPRALDFDHPVNKRPNHHFGGWDPHTIDNRGFYRRFVLQEVTIRALLARFLQGGDGPTEELLFEASAVLAGTMLMGSGITGNRPETHDSTVTLASLLTVIAEYRDAFYEELLGRVPQPHRGRLREEARRLLQPFGAARQHLNHSLARYRADQLQHVHLAQVFARMGHSQAALREAQAVPAASARMRCEIECRLSAAVGALRRGRLQEAASLVPQIEAWIHRGIGCGAFADPWNILGFGGQYSLFPAPENSVRDHRIDDLIEMVEATFALNARLQKEAAARREDGLRAQLSRRMEALAQWWDQFASTEVSDVDGFSGREIWEATSQVTTALAAWHEAGTSAGDTAFWRDHVQGFQSPSSFVMLLQSLLDQEDRVAAMALLVYWLSRADEVPLAQGEDSFHGLAVRWMAELWGHRAEGTGAGPPADGAAAVDPWPLTRRFFDLLEANAEQYWEVPRLQLDSAPARGGRPGDWEEEAGPEEPENLYAAAYENVTYRDTAEDGFEGELLDGGATESDFELAREAERLVDRLAFLNTLARLWALAAVASRDRAADAPQREERLAAWLSRAAANHEALLELLGQVHAFPLPAPRATDESLREYDRRRGIQEVIVERAITACTETIDAARLIRAAGGEGLEAAGPAPAPWEIVAVRLLRAIFGGDAHTARRLWPQLLEPLAGQQLLYRPTARGGNPRRAAAARGLHRTLQRLLTLAPRLGLLTETFQLLATAHEMERRHPAGPGAITEFDRLFEIGARGILDAIVASAETWTHVDRPDETLLGCLEEAVEPLLQRWLAHSRNIRVSVLETVNNSHRWRDLKAFIQRYGGELFTQQFMNLGNLRAILHQGVDRYLDWLAEESDDQESCRLLRDLDDSLSREDAVRWLELTLEAVAENYAEYVDYNSTTTQSDRGDQLYTLLDFLRLLAEHERVAWNLRPVVITHEVLVRRGRTAVAERWRDAVVERTREIADAHAARLKRLSRQYAMRLASIADRIDERFVRPLDVDRLRAQVRPAMDERERDRPGPAFAALEASVADFARQPTGVGFDMPSWLDALEDEVDRTANPTLPGTDIDDPAPPIPQTPLALDDLKRQLESWTSA